ncbi:MAG: hypothetical protein A2Y15_00220 [Clostridiales bacterium GWF2_36_10]|nr:MAG: hypothetical protein A2Y15_00220 [Clostridiales bacterium GWF2_36_10]
MAIRSLANARRGGFNKANIIAFIKFTFIAILAFILFLGFGTFSTYSIENSSSYQITDWKYIWTESEKELKNTVVGWETADSDNPIKNENKLKYLHLQTTYLTNNQYYILTLRSGNSPINVEIDGEKIVEQLRGNYMFSNISLNEILLEPSTKEKVIDVYMYVPTTFNFSVSSEATENGKANIRIVEISELVFGSIFVGFGLMLLSVAIAISIKKKNMNVFVLLGTLSAVYGFAVIFNQSGIFLPVFKSAIFYRLMITFLMLTAFFTKLVIARILEVTNELRWFTYISAIYAASYLLAPYSIIQLFLLKTFGIWSLICLIGFAFIVLRKGLPTIKSILIIITIFLTVLLGQTLYWLSYLIPIDIPSREAFLMAVGIYIIALICFFASNTFFGTQRLTTEFGDDNKNVWQIISRLLVTKADTNSNHLENVSRYVSVMCERMKMSPETIGLVASAALLHDIGKIAIPLSIIEKEDIITQEEYEQIRCHVFHGYNILTDPNDKFLQLSATIAKNHHERYDGTGYLGLKGNDIDIFSQITALADNFDALTAFRTYKKAWNFNDAWDYINTHAGDFFDPELVKIFNLCRKEFWEIYQRRNNAV